MLTRAAYLLENWSTFSSVFDENALSLLLTGCFVFDTSALMYTNSIVVLMVLLMPFFCKIYRKCTVCLYTFVNGISVVMNLADAVYFVYTGHRTTMSVVGEFQHESNLLKIFGIEILNHWYLVIFGVALIYSLYRLSSWILSTSPSCLRFTWAAALSSLGVLLLFVPLCIAGIRGGFTTAVRPITISNASQYVRSPQHAPLILNTPFSLLRTIGKNVFQDPGYYSAEELNQIYSPLHTPSPQDSLRKKNVVVLIVESFGREYIGAFNRSNSLSINAKAQVPEDYSSGYTPFIDSLYTECLSFDYSFANGRQSIDGMPSILSGIPRFIEPFFVTPASVNDVSGVAGELSKVGYHSAFFHGAENGSMGFEAFARATGFKEYYGRTEFNHDKRFRGNDDFDGTWAIWDEPFLQFYALKMSEMREPFVTAVFTASSHHPFRVPAQYADRYKDDGPNPIHKCIRYTDMALHRFFDTARQQPWFKNTIFVLTADHTNQPDHQEYKTDLGVFSVPILFYDPSGQMPRGHRHAVAQQSDIMPTVLSYLGYNRPYISWGIDLLNTRDADTWAVNHTSGGIYQYVHDGYLLQHDGQQLKAVYDIRQDWLLHHNLLTPQSQPRWADDERQLKAIIQTYMQRMVGNALILKP